MYANHKICQVVLDTLWVHCLFFEIILRAFHKARYGGRLDLGACDRPQSSNLEDTKINVIFLISETRYYCILLLTFEARYNIQSIHLSLNTFNHY